MKLKFKSNRKAFTLVELLIVIAIIGILFVVLVSKVDFATDKANATGVQTDFRSFQVAFETVSRENAGFNTLGWDTGDKADASLIAGYTYLNADKDGGDRIRNSYDKGDMNLNGICEEGETWTGQKLYTETWTGIYTLDNPADATDMSAYLALERAINKNLDPALQISMDPENKTIYMANGYQDPWKTEYHGFYLTNAANDGMDRGAIVMYSDGPNKIFGSEQTIANGIVIVTVKNGGINGQDDMSLVTCYTYTNGYGEIGTATFGFSNNQTMQSGNGNGSLSITPSEPAGPGVGGYQMLHTSSKAPGVLYAQLTFKSEASRAKFVTIKVDDSEPLIDWHYYVRGEQNEPTEIILSENYVMGLGTGYHTIEIISTDGSAIATFSVNVCETHEYDPDDILNCTCLACGEVVHRWVSGHGCDCGGTISYKDENGDLFCDICYQCPANCSYSSLTEHVDTNGDNECDGCLTCLSHKDTNGDNECDNCYTSMCAVNGHNFTEGVQCDNCGQYICEINNEHNMFDDICLICDKTYCQLNYGGCTDYNDDNFFCDRCRRSMCLSTDEHRYAYGECVGCLKTCCDSPNMDYYVYERYNCNSCKVYQKCLNCNMENPSLYKLVDHISDGGYSCIQCNEHIHEYNLSGDGNCIYCGDRYTVH